MKNTETDILASELPIVEEKGQFKTLEETIQKSGNWVPVAWGNHEKYRDRYFSK
ncbi:hypothetical protein [Weissella cibaria]|uniref:hypothetical protein n=1 Tax=Weissella cibaria TaxID=137591 RepID=UPI00164594F0|nr:hypothetical protein [Weissella cibaria]